jgi:hypothetical protein
VHKGICRCNLYIACTSAWRIIGPDARVFPDAVAVADWPCHIVAMPLVRPRVALAPRTALLSKPKLYRAFATALGAAGGRTGSLLVVGLAFVAATFISLFLVLPITAIFPFDPGREWTLAWWIWLAVTSVMFVLLHERLDKAFTLALLLREQLLLRTNLLETYTDERPYFLYLRSFAFKPEQERTYGAPKHIDAPERFPSAYWENLVAEPHQAIELALRRDGRLIAIGGRYRPRSSSSAMLVLSATETNWIPLMRELCVHARAILLHPGTTEGLLTEVRYVLQHGLLEKLVVVTTPTTRDAWYRIKSAFSELGLEWPPYTPGKRIFGFRSTPPSALSRGAPSEHSLTPLELRVAIIQCLPDPAHSPGLRDCIPNILSYSPFQ